MKKLLHLITFLNTRSLILAYLIAALSCQFSSNIIQRIKKISYTYIFCNTSLNPYVEVNEILISILQSTGSTATEIDDRLSPGNVTLLSGETALLACKIYNLGNKSVS